MGKREIRNSHFKSITSQDRIWRVFVLFQLWTQEGYKLQKTPIPFLALKHANKRKILCNMFILHLQPTGHNSFCIFSVVTMPALRPLIKPNIVKKRTKKFIRHQSDRYVKIKVGVLFVNVNPRLTLKYSGWWFIVVLQDFKMTVSENIMLKFFHCF